MPDSTQSCWFRVKTGGVTPPDIPLRVAVIGAGPSGFYAAESLLKGDETALVDVIDRLPTPYGLVRYGVAPDHERIKSVTRMLARIGADPRVRFLGNVQFGRDLDLADLMRHYHAVVFATGAPLDRNLGIPGEQLAGSLSATEFVAWYNGHPDYAHLEPDLGAEAAVVVGMGNVAVDVTRILAKSVDELKSTDMADHALEQLAESRVREIHMIGRRGPAQARFTTKELRELGELANADIVVDPRELELDPSSTIEAEGDPMVRRNLEVLGEFTRIPFQGKPRSVHLRFLLSPVELLGDERLREIRLERNVLSGAPGLGVTARGTGAFESIPAGLVFRSVGYRGTALTGVPFDDARAVIPNERGRVLAAPGGDAVPGLYAVGWIKRGPSGVIGSNKADAMETVAELLGDARREIAADDARPEAVTGLLRERGVRPVDFRGWEILDALETAAGVAQGRPRVKLTSVERMLKELDGAG